MKRKMLIILTLTLALFIYLAGCSSNSNSQTDNEETYYDQLLESGVLRVGATVTGPPFTFLNTETNEIDGFMIDVAEKIGEELGLEVEVVETEFASLIPAIESERIDIISAGMTITEERMEKINFSDRVYEYGEALVVPEDNTSLKTFEDLKGEEIGVQEGTAYYNGLLEYPEVKAQTYKSIVNMLEELDTGRISGFLGDHPIIQHMLNTEDRDFNVKIVETYEPKWTGDVGLGLPKDKKVYLEKVNEAIKKLTEAGEIQKIAKKWDL